MLSNNHKATLSMWLRWLALPLLVLFFFAGEGNGEFVANDAENQSAATLDDSTINGVPEMEMTVSSFPFSRVIEILEIEEEEEQEGNDKEEARFGFKLPSHLAATPLVVNRPTGITISSGRKLIKFFVLFHSWKLFRSV